jgi:arabinose-5-phosphate isomerase
MLSLLKDIVEQESRAIANIPLYNGFEEATDIIYRRVHENDGKLILTGVGKAGEIANSIGTVLSSTGTPSVFLHPLEAVHGDLGVMQKNDALLCVSNSGKTREIVELVPIAKKLVPDLPLICLTGHRDSPLAQVSDAVLYTGNPPEVGPLGLTPTTSTTVMSVIGDILSVIMMKRIGFTKDEYGKRHHGGYLGAIAKQENETDEYYQSAIKEKQMTSDEELA